MVIDKNNASNSILGGISGVPLNINVSEISKDNSSYNTNNDSNNYKSDNDSSILSSQDSDIFSIESSPFIIKMADAKDKDAIRGLWELCFNDTKDFVDWFFENRFSPENTACVKLNGSVVCAMQSIPVSLNIRGYITPSMMVAGVCTHPEYRGHHLMKRMFAFFLEQILAKGYIAVTYKPENPLTYRSLGHYLVTDTAHLSVSQHHTSEFRKTYIDDLPLSYRFVDLAGMADEDMASCHRLYTNISSGYSGSLQRSYEQFRFKTQDYSCVGARAVLVYEGSDLTGYCFYFDMDDVIYGEECMATDFLAARSINLLLCSIASGKGVKNKLPTHFAALYSNSDSKFIASDTDYFKLLDGYDTPENFKTEVSIGPQYVFDLGGYETTENFQIEVTPQNAIGVTDIKALVSGMYHQNPSRFNCDLSRLSVQIVDQIITSNNLIIDMCGNESEEPPCAKINIGDFAQFLCGYKLFTQQPDVEIINLDKLLEIQSLYPPCECFCVDEY